MPAKVVECLRRERFAKGQGAMRAIVATSTGLTAEIPSLRASYVIALSYGLGSGRDRQVHEIGGTAAMLKVAAHVALLFGAVVVFYLGLGVGLQVSPLLGTALWLVAGTMVVLNVVWVVRGYFG